MVLARNKQNPKQYAALKVVWLLLPDMEREHLAIMREYALSSCHRHVSFHALAPVILLNTKMSCNIYELLLANISKQHCTYFTPGF